MDSDSRFVVTPRTVLGLSIALLGVMLTLDRLGIAHVDNLFRRFWPVPIVLMGGLMLVQARDGRERMRGIVFTGIGTWLFLNMQGLVSIRLWELFWPLVLVLIGVSMVTRRGPSNWSQRRRDRLERKFARRGRFGPRGPFGPDGPFGPNGPMGTGSFGRRPQQNFSSTDASSASDAPSGYSSPADSAEHISMFSVWSSTRRTSSSTAFRGGDITAIMGGAQLDLRVAKIPAGQDAVLDITAVMGGVEIFVPAHWEVSTPVLPFMGAVEDERLPPIQQDQSSARAASGRLVIRGFVMMGGVTIKS